MRISAVVLLVSLSLGLLPVSLARGQAFTFTKVADTSTPIPGGVGNFTEFRPPSISDGEVAFIGEGSGGQLGVYLWKNGVLSVAVDTGTLVPGGTGTFTALGRNSFHEGALAFNAGNFAEFGVVSVGHLGIYTLIDGTLEVVVDTSTEIPGSPGVQFEFFGVPWIYDLGVVFMGGNTSAVPNQGGVYLLRETGQLVRIAGLGTDIPGGGTFTEFPFTDRAPSLDDGNVAFWGTGVHDGEPVEGVYVSEAGVLMRISQLRFETGGFFDLSRPILSDGKVTFGTSVGTGFESIRQHSVDLTEFGVLYDLSTQVPGRIGTFSGLALQRSGQGPSVSFLGSSNVQQGIYTDINGQLEEVIHATDLLDGKNPGSMGHYAEGTSRNQVIFLVVAFNDDSSGIFIATSTLCGDGFVNPDTEECDDGNSVSGDGCSSCRLDLCGDVNDSGAVDGNDVGRLREHLTAPLTSPLTQRGRDNWPVIDPDGCDITAGAVLRRALHPPSLPPGIAPVCPFITSLAPNGAFCLSDEECASRFCTEGLCCDSACLSECESCLATDTARPDGICAPRSSAIEVCDLVDNDCDLEADEPDAQDCGDFFVDGDGDGFGDPGDSACLCDATDTHTVTNADDCYDLNPSANPAQMSFFSVDRGDGSFDYDCNSIEEPEFRELGSCTLIGGRCALSVGWSGIVPPCGVPGRRITGCTFTFPSCLTDTTQRVQSCR